MRARANRCWLVPGALIFAVWLAVTAVEGSSPPNRFERLSLEDGLSQSTVLSIAQDERGFMWFGTEDGLNRFDGREFRHFRREVGVDRSLEGDFIWAVVEDPGAAEPVFVNYSHDSGLPSAVVYGIEGDLRGNLWISTNFGLSVLSPDGIFVAHYNRSHGLQSNEFNFGAHGRSRSGEMFFGGPSGFNAFQPEDLERNTVSPQLTLTSILTGYNDLVTETPISELQILELSYRDRSVTFEFAALDFAAPDENRYACKLDGFDGQWNELGAVNRVTYTNLGGGDYTLRIRGANADGVWNEDGISLHVVVAPPPWKTWWANAIYLLVGALAIGGFVVYQRGKLRREERHSGQLAEEVKVRTGELADRNTELEEKSLRLAQASRTDALTGLANRHFLIDMMDREAALVRRQYADLRSGGLREESLDIVFMMVDLDQFKVVNDSFGHVAGDVVLTQMRDILVGSCRETDIVIRWGGDEFLIVARDVTPEATSVVAERIRAEMESHPFEIGSGQVIRATCSVGFASFPFHRDEVDLLSWEQVVSVADRAMYVAKRSGRNHWVGLNCSAAVPADNLYTRIQNDPAGLFEEGAIEVMTSAAVADQLEWD